MSFFNGFLASMSVIILSELGDKTWFIAVIMAMRYSRLAVFSGAMGANLLMTVVSASLGWVTIVIPRSITHFVSIFLFIMVGLKMLHDGHNMSDSEGQEEFEKAEEEVTKREKETGKRRDSRFFPSTVFIEAFTITFFAEWGDRSQFTTIILGARENLVGVIIGGILGHAICTGIAVLGGKLVAERISVRTVTLLGGVLFLFFAISAIFFHEED